MVLLVAGSATTKVSQAVIVTLTAIECQRITYLTTPSLRISAGFAVGRRLYGVLVRKIHSIIMQASSYASGKCQEDHNDHEPCKRRSCL
ncbi:MAG: hypothetical protein WC598_00765 [Methanoregula sp.]